MTKIDPTPAVARPAIVTDAMLSYLYKLRRSGETNMYGAAPYLAGTFLIDKREAREVLSYWMKTFSEDEEARVMALAEPDEDDDDDPDEDPDSFARAETAYNATLRRQRDQQAERADYQMGRDMDDYMERQLSGE